MVCLPRRAIAATCLVLLTACGSDPTPPGGGPATSSDAIPEILRFEYPLLDGGTLRGADLAGTDVALWFWAPW